MILRLEEAPERGHNIERNSKWWREHAAGRTMTYLAQRDGVSLEAVSRGIAQVRAGIPPAVREEEIQRSLDMLHDLRAGAVEIWEKAPTPVFVGRDGDPAIDPDTGDYVRDYTGKLRALETALKVDKRISDLLGLDAAQKMDVSVAGGEQEAARQLAEEALARLRGERDAGR